MLIDRLRTYQLCKDPFGPWMITLNTFYDVYDQFNGRKWLLLHFSEMLAVVFGDCAQMNKIVSA